MGNVSGFFNIIAKINSSFCMSGSLFFVLPCTIQLYKDLQFTSAFDYCEESSYEHYCTCILVNISINFPYVYIWKVVLSLVLMNVALKDIAK